MPAISDSSAIRRILSTDPVWSAYALGDLAPGLFEACVWRAAPREPALTLVYRGFVPPVLFAMGEPEAVDSLLAETTPEPSLFLHVRPEMLPILERRYRDCRSWKMWRMVFRADAASSFILHPSSFPTVVRLHHSDLAALESLYSDGDPNGEAPGFFLRSMLENGVYYGVREADALIAAAGTHLVIPEEGVAAIGNVYTRRDRRGRGLAALTTGAVAAELLRKGLSTIVLNVNPENAPAVRAYQRLGFRRHCDYVEGTVRDAR